MYVSHLIHLLQEQDPCARVFFVSDRHDLESDIQEAGDPCLSSIAEVVTYPTKPGVYIIESYDRKYFA